jgi:hypothetical protein
MPWRVTRRLREFIRATRLTYPRGGNFFARWENGDVTRVEWTRTEPGDIEQVVSMLLCRENPSAVRVRASRGDGGIDVLAPAENGAGVAVYQVKSFSSNLTASQKAQVERSFRRVLDYAKGRGLQMTEWYLTLPIDPTNENLAWLGVSIRNSCDRPLASTRAAGCDTLACGA